MLHEFLLKNRRTLIDLCRANVASRSGRREIDADFSYGIPVFLDQLIHTLKAEQASGPVQSQKISGPGGGPSARSELGISAASHGRELSAHGFTVEQVVHDYGDLCQAITALAFECNVSIEVQEFRTLNRCLDNGIADAVTAFTYQRALMSNEREGQALNQRLGFLARELRSHIDVATQAVGIIKSGKVGLSGATSTLLDKSLARLREIVEKTLAGVRLESGMAAQRQPICVADLLTEIEASALPQARHKGCSFRASAVDRSLAVEVDQELLLSALGILVQNAIKFTKSGTCVVLSAHADADRIQIDVKDHCGGLPPGDKEDMFIPFKHYSGEKSGLGLGLAICRRSVEANNGILSVHNVPGSGCVFSIVLPRHLNAVAPRIRPG